MMLYAFLQFRFLMGSLCPGGGGGTIKQIIKNGYLQYETEVSSALMLTEVL